MHRALLALALLWTAGLTGCAHVDPACQKQIDACLAHCQRARGEDQPKTDRPPEDTMTPCADQCMPCRQPAASPSPQPSAPPTFTGNAQ